MATKKTYTDKFKIAAVERVLKGEPAPDVTKSLGITTGMLYKWKKNYQAGAVSKRGKKTATRSNQVHDAIIFLTHAKRDIYSRLRESTLKEMDVAHMYTIMALNALEGKE
jgi:transposase-like protein